jgi:hypothetical protein
MKTKDVIAMLQKEDPSGEIDVCVGNVDISFISREAAYYDGSQQVLIRNESGRAIGGKYKRQGDKVQIHLLPFSTLLWDKTEINIDYSELGEIRGKEYKDNHDKIKAAALALDCELELEYFTKHIKERAEKLGDDEENDLNDIIKDFFMANITPKEKFPDDIPFIGLSYIDRRNIQWGREVSVNYTEDGFVLKKEKDNGTSK